MVFEKTLTDIVKGIRASKRDTAVYISTCIAEIKTEIHSTDPHTKANALQKLTFLQMMGYNMSWASFPTIEVMSSTRFAYKRIGYLAAIQAFTQDTEVVLLATNLLKKELRGAIGPGMHGVYEAGLAINCLANIVTEDLARELLPDITNLISHPQPYLRKKALLCLFKIFVKYPQALRLTFGKIQQSLLQDTNASVVSCAVNVITELSDKNPKNYLMLAPTFFDLLTKSSNNWMLIKVVKLLGSLVAEEPRLARKLLDPLSKIVQNTQAKSLLYEAVSTVTLCLPHCRKNDGTMPTNVPIIVELCAKTLKEFVQDSDQNLKYLGLVGFGSLMVSHPKVLSASDYRPLILSCLSDEDVTIRKRSLDLLISMATKKNIVELVTQLLRHVDLATGQYKADLVVKILEICSSEKYALLSDFAWYVDVLVLLARTRGIGGFTVRDNEHLSDFLSSQILDVALRVLPVRAYMVRRMIGILLERNAEHTAARKTSKELQRHGVTYDGQFILQEVLSPAAWIVGEYSTLVSEAIRIEKDNAEDEDELFHYDVHSLGTYHALIQALTDSSNIDSISLSTQSIFLQASIKVLAAASLVEEVSNPEFEACLMTLATNLPIYMHSLDIEVQERAFTSFHLLASLNLFTTSGSSETGIVSRTETPNTSNINPMNGNLLTLRENFDDIKLSRSDATTSTASDRLRRNSNLLKTLFISEQMKPMSQKAQRKLQQSVTGELRSLLLQPVDFSVFTSALSAEKVQRPICGIRNTLDVVSFTQQKLFATATALNRKETTTGHGFIDKDETKPSIMFDPAIGSQPEPSNLNAGDRLNDPFYLPSSITNSEGNEISATVGSKRFGTIQLLDSDDELKDRKKNRKSKKDKKRPLLTDTDVGLLNSLVKGEHVQHQVYRSDDDEQSGKNARDQGKSAKGRNANIKGFEGLAMIDLTKPVPDNDAVINSDYRVESTRQYDSKARSSEENKSSHRKKKSKRKISTETVKMSVNIGDLLDFEGLVDEQHPKKDLTVSSTQPSISPFDDLLSLTITEPKPQPTKTPASLARKDSSLSSSNSSSRETELWLVGHMKQSHARGTGTSIDWTKVQLLYKTFFSKENNTNTAVLSLKLVNDCEGSALSNAQIHLTGSETIVAFDDVAPKSSACTKTVLGPFTVDESKDIRGTLSTSGWVIPVKISLPSSRFLNPIREVDGFTLNECLSNGNWFQFMVKVALPESVDLVRVKSLLKWFLKADEVLYDSPSSCSSYILATGTSGAKLFILVKVAGRLLKIEVKCDQEDMGKDVSSELKRLYFS